MWTQVSTSNMVSNQVNSNPIIMKIECAYKLIAVNIDAVVATDIRVVASTPPTEQCNDVILTWPWPQRKRLRILRCSVCRCRRCQTAWARWSPTDSCKSALLQSLLPPRLPKFKSVYCRMYVHAYAVMYIHVRAWQVVSRNNSLYERISLCRNYFRISYQKFIQRISSDKSENSVW